MIKDNDFYGHAGLLWLNGLAIVSISLKDKIILIDVKDEQVKTNNC